MIVSILRNIFYLMILVLLPSQVLANNYFCTIERMGRTYETSVSDEKPASHLKSFGFQVKSNSVKFSDKGWFVSDRMDIRSKEESGGQIVSFSAANYSNIVNFRNNKLWASTLLSSSVMSFIADCEKL